MSIFHITEVWLQHIFWVTKSFSLTICCACCFLIWLTECMRFLYVWYFFLRFLEHYYNKNKFKTWFITSLCEQVNFQLFGDISFIFVSKDCTVSSQFHADQRFGLVKAFFLVNEIQNLIIHLSFQQKIEMGEFFSSLK